MRGFFQDFRYALRQLRKSPGFTALAVLTLALGIGLNSAMFSVVNAVVLRELPIDHPKQIVFPTIVGPHGSDDGFAYAEFEEIRDHSFSFSGVFAFDTTRFLAVVNGQTDYLFGQCVSTNFYSVLGVKPILGRGFTSQDDQAGQPPVVVISYDYWQRKVGLDPAVMNQSISLKKIPFRIVGVAPPSFHGIELGDAVDIWIPMIYWPQVRLSDHLTAGIMGRLKPEMTTSQAAAELNVLDGRYVAQGLESNQAERSQQPLESRRIELRSGARGLFDLADELPQELNILMAVVGLVLLIACANVANLVLVRALNRRRESAMRLALGASRLRLIRQLLTESLLLAISGGGLGLLLAVGATNLLSKFVIGGFDPLGVNSQLDARVLWFSLGVSVLTGLGFGLAPAFGATRVDPAHSLQSGERSDTGDKSRRRLSQVLIVSQVALCVSLLVGAGLMVKSLKRLSEVNPGFQQDHILLAFLYPTLGGYPGTRELNLYSALQEQVSGAPGVTSASLSRFRLLSGGGGWHRRIGKVGNAVLPGEGLPVHCNPVAPKFFATMGIPLVLGRDFTAADGANAAKVAIISEALAHTEFPHQSPIGQQVEFVGDSGNAQAVVVGVVRDIRSYNLRSPDDVAGVYVPLAQAPPDLLGQAVLEVRTTGEPSVAIASIRRVAQAIDADFPMARMSTQAEQMTESLTTERSLATLLSLFSALAVTLASIGLYGVIAYSTARRTREIGVRVALGARPWDVLQMVLTQGVRLTLIGTGVGLAGAVVGARMLSSKLFGVTLTDPVIFAGVTLILAAVALAASYIPARRAAKIDPMAALRYE
ncbi:MAG TPA: ABC transporter permease [Candidatus Sulfotelmatobacter sp.]